MEHEFWEDTLQYRDYQVSNLGRVRNKKYGRIVQPVLNNRDVLVVSLSAYGGVSTVAVKKLVADVFVPKAPAFEGLVSCVIRHIDEDPTNCRADNLNYALRGDAAWIKRIGVSWGRPVLAVTADVVYEDAVEAAAAYTYGCDISIKKICMEGDGWHCNETFRWAEG